MSSPLSTRYPRTLFEWLKSDDKLLLKAIADGQSVLELAEDLSREHISVLRRCDSLGIFEFNEGSEEWAEFYGLSLAGVPLNVVVDWCTGAMERLELEDIESLAMGDLRGEFALARDLGITVANSDVVGDLSWLLNQPDEIRAGYASACDKVRDGYDVLTPGTLKAQVLGLTPAAPEWLGYFPSGRTGTYGSRPGKAPAYAKPRKKSYRRKAGSSTSSTVAGSKTRTVKAKSSRAYAQYKRKTSSKGRTYG